MREILDTIQIEEKIQQLAADMSSYITDNVEPAIIGIRSRGEVLAQRLTNLLEKKLDHQIPMGVLDITLYRDDLNDPHGDEMPVLRATEIDFDVTGKVIFLVDDVLHTGRSVRAAMDALVDIGRPKAIRLAVLVDRGHREYPIQADFVGIFVDVADDKRVEVEFVETDEIDRVRVEKTS